MNPPPTIAVDTPQTAGAIIKNAWLGRDVRIVAEITRAEFETDLMMRRDYDRARGRPPARRGVYNTQTGEFTPMPSLDLPAGMLYFYRIEPA